MQCNKRPQGKDHLEQAANAVHLLVERGNKFPVVAADTRIGGWLNIMVNGAETGFCDRWRARACEIKPIR